MSSDSKVLGTSFGLRLLGSQIDADIASDLSVYAELKNFILITKLQLEASLAIDSRGVRGLEESGKSRDFNYFFCLDIVGSQGITYCMFLSNRLLLHASATMYMYETDEVDDDVVECGMELTNTIVGGANVAQSRIGEDVSMGLPVGRSANEFKSFCSDKIYHMIYSNSGFELGFVLLK